jgi:peptidoglycan/xylan/chitin deacetylase (PgdA/CDA1 family)
MTTDAPYGPTRSPAADSWLNDAAAIVVLGFDLDAEETILALGEQYASDLSTMSHQAYGPLVGVPRILDLLDRHGVPGTFFIPGAAAEQWPSTVRSITAAGHEIALHGQTHESLTNLDAEAQANDFNTCLAALRELEVDPRGYRAPYWQQTSDTLALIADAGLLYDSSLMDDDRPYVLHISGRELVELPVHWGLDDWEQYAFLPDPDIGQRIVAPSRVAELWLEELDAMRGTRSLCALTCHPFLSGRPSRIRALENFIKTATEFGDVEFASCAEVAERVSPRPA